MVDVSILTNIYNSRNYKGVLAEKRKSWNRE